MKRTPKWSIPVTEQLDNKLTEHVKMYFFKTKSEFIRTAVRDRLEKERSKELSQKNLSKDE